MAVHEKTKNAVRIIEILRAATKTMPEPASLAIVKKYGHNPYLVLISCLLSLRARDAASLPVSIELFKQAKTPAQMLKLRVHEIEKIIYSIGFYKNKAKQLHEVSKALIERFAGVVPDTYDELTSIKGIGPKTANLVLSEGFGQPAIIVDVHVHRVSNRLGLIKTDTVQETQQALEEILPKKYWREYSQLVVTWGQNICGPVSPWCSKCPLFDICKRVGVMRRR
jgi:endonuclease-3